MKLSFLGKSYEVPFNLIQGEETYEMLTYMGKQYPRKECHISQRLEPSMTLTYMGRPYIR